MQNFHSQEIKKVMEYFSTSEEGLSNSQAKEKLKEFGFNEFQKQKKREAMEIFFGQFNNFLMLLLFGAVIISTFLNEVLESIAIIFVMLLSAVLGFFQEYKAEKAMEKLQKLTTPKAKVIREGQKVVIPVKNVVPGDLIFFEAGDIIPADARVIEEVSLKVDEASLTGESVPSKKTTDVLPENFEIADRENIVYASTIVTYGKGKAIVVATGNNTEFGKIALSLNKTERKITNLEQKFEQISKIIGAIVLVIIGFVLVIGLIRGGMNFQELLVFSLSLAVAAVPNSLPAIVTVSLALGAQELTKKKMIIRKLDAIQNLGQINVICTDKTGTLTKNEMTVVKVFAQNKEYQITGTGYDNNGKIIPQKEGNVAFDFIIKTSVLCNDSKVIRSQNKATIIGDPTEAALIVFAEKTGVEVEKERANVRIIKEFPFDSDRKMMSVVIQEKNKRLVLVKGSPELVLKKSSWIINEKGKVVRLKEKDKELVLQTHSSFAKEALRVIGFAYKELKAKANEPEDVENKLIFLGIVGMIDPPRENVNESIKEAKKAGIKVMMITGDHVETAIAIAKKIELYEEGDLIITGDEIEKMSDEKLERIIEKITIIARALPIQKLRIVKALKRSNKVIAMTGDGVNDAPALKSADVGISMGLTGTEVAKEVSSATIADDNFSTIIIGIKEGKTIYEKIMNSTKYLLSCNLGEITIVVGTMLANLPLPLTPLQILTMNLLTDGLPAIGLGFEKIEKKELQKNTTQNKEPLNPQNIKAIIFFGLVMGTASLILFSNYLPEGLTKAQTIAFTTLVMLQMFAALGSRSSLPFKSFERITENKVLIVGIVSSIALQLLIIYFEPLQKIFNTMPLSFYDWTLIIGISILGSMIMESQKILDNKNS